MTDVEGGLDEPDELQPEPGALALASARRRLDARGLGEGRRDGPAEVQADDRRRPRRDRLAEADPQTLDGIDISPLGTPDLLDGLVTSRPPDAGRPAGRSAPRSRPTRTPSLDLEGGVTSLWFRAGSAPDWATLLDGVRLDLAPVVLDGADPEGFLSYAAGRELAAGTNLGFDARTATGEQAALATRAGVLGFVVDATVVHDQGPPTSRSSATRCRSVRRPCGPSPTRPPGRRGGRPDRVPPRRDRRAVPLDRQAPRGPPALGPGPRAQRRRAAGHAPARRDEPADDERLRPLGEPAAHHRRRLRGRRRRSRRGHRAAVRRPLGGPTPSGAGSRATPARS